MSLDNIETNKRIVEECDIENDYICIVVAFNEWPIVVKWATLQRRLETSTAIEN